MNKRFGKRAALGLALSVAVFALALIPFLAESWHLVRESLLRRTGTPANAEVLDLGTAPQAPSPQPGSQAVRVEIRFDADGKPIVTHFEQRTTDLAIRPLQPGNTVRIIYDPADPMRVVRAEP